MCLGFSLYEGPEFGSNNNWNGCQGRVGQPALNLFGGSSFSLGE